MLIAASGYIAMRTSQKTLEKAIGESSATLAAQTLNNINKNIYRRIENIEAHATNDLLREYTARSNAQFENLPDPNGYIEQTDRDWVSGADLTPLMRELTNNKLSMRLKTLRSFYDNKYGYPLFAEIFVTNRFGANVAQTNKTTDYYQADEEWWQVAQKDGVFVGDLSYDESSNTFSTDIGVRVDDAAGNFLGVVKGVLNIQETINIINEVKADAEYKTLQLHLTNKDGKIVYSTKGYSFFENIYSQLVLNFGYPDQPNYKCYVVTQKPGERELLLAHAHSKGYKDFKGLSWVLLVETDTAEILAPIIHLRNVMLLIGLAVMGLALVASTITYRSIVIPIAELQKATVQIAAGNLDTNLTTTTNDEIGHLADSFQKMACQLKNTIADLNGEIAEHKKAEDGLHESKRFLNGIFDAMQDGISVLDKDLNIVKVNAWSEKTRSDAMPLVGKKCFEAYHQRHTPCPNCPSILALRTGQQHTEIVPVPSTDNLKWWFEITASPLKDADGKVVGIIEHVKDNTERKHAEELLRNAEERFRTVFENTVVGLYRTTPDGRILLANPALVKMMGYQSFEELAQLNLEKEGIDSSTPRSMFKQCVEKEGKVIGLEAVWIKRDGTKLFVSESASAVRDEHGNILYYEGTAEDVTEYKKAKKALDKLNQDLQLAVDEISRSNRQLQDFVHVAAHDLKTPVRGIGTLADWIASDYGDSFDEQGREQVRLLKARVIRIDKLIDGMLLFSKIVRTRQNEKQVALNSLVSEVIDKMRPPDNIEIAVDSLPGVTCEYEHISQVFQSLLSNAVAFMDKPKGLIKVGCVEQGEFWRFYISDNGPGIEQKYFEKIFRIFQTLPRKDEPETAGIGLAVAKKIVEMYGGKIWLESEAGKGTTFFFTFPKADTPEPSEEQVGAFVGAEENYDGAENEDNGS